jgi:hypothetical protein
MAWIDGVDGLFCLCNMWRDLEDVQAVIGKDRALARESHEGKI